MNKQYVDTSALDAMQDPKSMANWGDRIEAMRTNGSIIHSVAEASKNKGSQAAAEEEAKKKQVQA